MESAAADVIILGASGFTGKRVLGEFLRKLPEDRKVGIAGRSRQKLEESLSWALGHTSEEQRLKSSVPIFEADVHDMASLRGLCSKTKLLVSCVGPYRLYGEPVVAACVEAGIDYLDITGEPEFMERMRAKYHEQAVDRESLVVSACGFDSVPAEFGVIFNTKQWQGSSKPNSIDAYLTLRSSTRMKGNFATFESAVLGIASVGELQKLRKSRPIKSPRLQIPGVPLKRPAVHWEDAVNSWAVKIPSSDAVLVRRTLATVAENPDGLPTASKHQEQSLRQWTDIKPVLFGVYLSVKELWRVCFLLLTGFILYVLANFGWGRKLLLSYPEVFTGGVFSKTGPSQEEIDNSSFSMVFVGRGFKDASKVPPGKKQQPDMEIITRVTGPEIGYVTTPIILVQAALLVLENRDKLPKGGVWTPGVAFGTTDYEQRLQNNGLSFDVISKH
ncbi:hypothetical protein SELMODRAFT_77069 [Selaginella moellendorffii]|uniref:Saccharopine dehydrogenase NADP binding domain-containing protein n=1 Tax=Selaginella moellendorffii TaxID=88036 RepID=D8QS22_SELML|nr:probable mitochondrial saccharopine dehydrogenase-like oxidoreductase At5g39410 [Selaginella moellendorffii]EFJ37365.1 hypothetical protein SELMODRAFT_77069 [Selaginella moellendorffii]|eukprot:XP_002962105.1 probable mitochondrial saccharopine dehydrogenase-like oxidoreductase At5g39410 [Selaginella moellendorffii]